jgi:DNA polymerase (family 10)
MTDDDDNNSEGGTMRLEEARPIAERVKEILTPYCERIEIAGSIRRQKPVVNDIDLVIIEKPDAVLSLATLLFSMGVLKLNGPDIKRLYLPSDNITLDIYIATPLTWSTLLLIRTGSKGNNIRLATIAMRRGWQLKANGDGLFDEHNNRVAGDTEQSIYQALGIPYQEPGERDGVHS